jgi:hypothetical protein
MKKILFVICTILAVINVSAQQKDSLIKANEIEVIKTFKPTLSDAIKIPVNPNPETPESTMPEFKYKQPEQQYQTLPTMYAIKPISLGTALLPKLKNNYTRLGFGNYVTPMFEMYLTSLRNKNWQGGVFAKHLSSTGDSEFNNFSNNTLYAFGKRFFDAGSISADAYYYRNVAYLYGYQPESLKLKADDYKLIYNTIDVKLAYENKVKDSNDLALKVNANYYNYSNNREVTDNDFVAAGIFSKRYVGVLFDLKTAININNTGFKNVSYNRTYFDFNPRVTLNDVDFYLKGGFNLTYMSDSNKSEQSGVFFYPVAEAGYHIIKQKLTTYAGLTGDYKKNTFRSISSENPFTLGRSDTALHGIYNTNKQIEFYLGLKGSLGKRTFFSIYGSVANYKNMLFFGFDSSNSSQLPLYDNGKLTLTTMQLELNHHFGEKFRTGLTLTSYDYSMDKLLQPSAKPSFEAKWNNSLNLADKFLFRLDLFYMNERMALSYVPGKNSFKEYKLQPMVDANFAIDYRYNKHVSAFLNINNFANNQYQRWLNYNVYGFNVLGGMTFTF